MKFTIYGSGCAKCKQLTANAEAAARALDKSYDVEKITDTNAIIDAGIMRTPALAVDGEIVIEGKVSSAEEIKGLLR
ncbi:MAG: thioredoxin family protein [Porticoccaceae bacterium]|jgi:small redox-active disulfide protein 2|nr:thioredoxin family protein [Porticoccaceae bacterium]MEA3299358.1 thioredoxin family protein [Pseudomonadota bacterium]HLS99716.1 thioredoxin family protein [Porticoccaceae bacterium]